MYSLYLVLPYLRLISFLFFLHTYLLSQLMCFPLDLAFLKEKKKGGCSADFVYSIFVLLGRTYCIEAWGVYDLEPYRGTSIRLYYSSGFIENFIGIL
ncbi:hypothetical protein BJX76DRAFT_143495 [Aspergillus varians]